MELELGSEQTITKHRVWVGAPHPGRLLFLLHRRLEHRADARGITVVGVNLVLVPRCRPQTVWLSQWLIPVMSSSSFQSSWRPPEACLSSTGPGEMSTDIRLRFSFFFFFLNYETMSWADAKTHKSSSSPSNTFTWSGVHSSVSSVSGKPGAVLPSFRLQY